MHYRWSQLILIMNLNKGKICWRKLRQKLEWLQRSDHHGNIAAITLFVQEREVAEEVNREARRKLEDYRVPEVEKDNVSHCVCDCDTSLGDRVCEGEGKTV